MSAAAFIGFLKISLLVCILAWMGLVLFAFLFTNKLVFPAPPSGYRDSDGLIKIPFNKSGDEVTAVFLENPHSEYLIFYHHGNGEDLQGLLPRLEMLRKLGFAVLAWDYPGYGTSDGRPTEKSVFEAAEKVWQEIPNRFGYAHNRVVLYGRSLGGGPGILLAQRHEPAGLILEGVFTSIYRVGLPFRILPWDIFDNLKRIDSINCPLLVLHGTEDRTVPFSHGKELYERAPDPKFFAWFSGGGHNDLVDTYSDTYYSSIREFKQHLIETH